MSLCLNLSLRNYTTVLPCSQGQAERKSRPSILFTNYNYNVPPQVFARFVGEIEDHNYLLELDITSLNFACFLCYTAKRLIL